MYLLEEPNELLPPMQYTISLPPLIISVFTIVITIAVLAFILNKKIKQGTNVENLPQKASNNERKKLVILKYTNYLDALESNLTNKPSSETYRTLLLSLKTFLHEYEHDRVYAMTSEEIQQLPDQEYGLIKQYITHIYPAAYNENTNIPTETIKVDIESLKNIINSWRTHN